MTVPYIAVKMWPKTDAEKKAMAENLAKTVADTLNCPLQYVSVSMEEIQPEAWDEYFGAELEAKKENMYIIQGEKTAKFD